MVFQCTNHKLEDESLAHKAQKALEGVASRGGDGGGGDSRVEALPH